MYQWKSATWTNWRRSASSVSQCRGAGKGWRRNFPVIPRTFGWRREEGYCLGFAGMHAVCGECYVDLVAVRPSARRQGIGEQLVKRMIAWMEEHRGEFITLEVRMSNTPAIALYEKLGFAKAGVRKNFYENNHEDALLLTRQAMGVQ
ncbi:ribosomal protein S18-alanine N-acetyltransferase [Anaeromassilibacillus sp. SJQ-1]|uniref:ribosomal protein S18-alanine N-acetyltransferase n=1 Tax=Anaeromassilibacillus sp. SJQ-1 TaxID=3375419 RepID=UPI003988BD29